MPPHDRRYTSDSDEEVDGLGQLETEIEDRLAEHSQLVETLGDEFEGLFDLLGISLGESIQPVEGFAIAPFLLELCAFVDTASSDHVIELKNSSLWIHDERELGALLPFKDATTVDEFYSMLRSHQFEHQGSRWEHPQLETARRRSTRTTVPAVL